MSRQQIKLKYDGTVLEHWFGNRTVNWMVGQAMGQMKTLGQSVHKDEPNQCQT